jgi:hypothetical protein
MIKESGIPLQDQQENAQAIIDVIGFMKQVENQSEADYAFSKFNNVYAAQYNHQEILQITLRLYQRNQCRLRNHRGVRVSFRLLYQLDQYRLQV